MKEYTCKSFIKVFVFYFIFFAFFICSLNCHKESAAINNFSNSNNQSSNDQSKPNLKGDFAQQQSGVNHSQIEFLTNEIITLYKPIAEVYNATLTAQFSWDKDNPGGQVVIQSPRIWKMVIRGGSHPLINEDVFSGIICHEMGHIAGGFPFRGSKRESLEPYGTVTGSEGQADYFATKECLWRLWHNDFEKNADYQHVVEDSAKNKCDSEYADQSDRELCYRIMTASLGLALYLATTPFDSGSNPRFETPDNNEVERTNILRSNVQCRLDTFVAGALCSVKHPENYIPGLLPSINDLYGEHGTESESDAAQYACINNHPGARSRCWFKQDMPDVEPHMDFDCTGIPEFGKCEGNTVVTCTTESGISRWECEESETCEEVDEDGFVYSDCMVQ